VRYLLDTHTLLWAIRTPGSLSRKALKAIDDRASTILVSAASAWEIATKVRLGKFPGAEAFERRFIEAVNDAGYMLLSIDAEIALRAARLIADHRDPFDRIIAAHALALDIPVTSTDPKLDLFGVQRIW
jgi:PIN domain nuclease of toxin-antitoxin system